MNGLNFIAVRIVDQSPTCRLCGDQMIEWSATDNWVWFCFNCDMGE